jgi:hypothetical protein
MRPVPGAWDSLRLAGKAEHRAKAAEKLRPTFEKRLTELGYSSQASAHAFSTLTGTATVEEALVVPTPTSHRRRNLAVDLVLQKTFRGR